MAYTTINKSTSQFNTKLYTGTGSSQSLTGVGFQPGMVWAKVRDASYFHYLADEVRGVLKEIKPNSPEAQSATQTGLSAFNSDGFTMLGYRDSNENNKTYASWNWKGSGSQGSSNTTGSINTTYTSLNTTGKLSISTYTGNGSAGATIGHGLGVKPSMIIVKRLNLSEDYAVYHKSLGATKYLALNTTGAVVTANARWYDVEPTTSVFSVGSHITVNGSGSTYVAYCFADVQGFSKMGNYTGNGNADGPFIYTGFKPAFVMVKRTDATNFWLMRDSKRSTFNVTDKTIAADSTSSEAGWGANYLIDYLSNGFKCRDNTTPINASGGNYIYMAFAEAPLVGTNNVPCTAR